MAGSKTNWLWFAAYLVAICGVIGLVLYGRQTTLREMDTPAAHAQWKAWREAEPNQSNQGPVRRLPPIADEPPALLLMRDHFTVVMVGAVLFSSLLFAALMMAARGVFASNSKQGQESTRHGESRSG